MALRIANAYAIDSGVKADESRQQQIVGWYTANERVGKNDEPGQAALKVTSAIKTIRSKSGYEYPSTFEPVLIVVKSLGLAKILDVSDGLDEATENDGSVTGALVCYGKDISTIGFKPLPSENFSVFGKTWVESTDAAINVALSDCAAFYDFEDHLEGGVDTVKERNWIQNPDVAKILQRKLEIS